VPLVPEPHRRRSIWIAILGSLALFLLGSAFVPVEGQLKGVCLLEPARYWTFTERRVGSYESRTDDHITGRILSCRLHQFDRGAVLDLGLGADGISGQRVEAKQVVAALQSSDIDLELAERSTALGEARGRLADLQAGAKPATLAHARLEAERAAAELSAHNPRYERQRTLFEQGGISSEEWESVAAQRELLQLDVQLAAAEQEILESGGSPERIAAAEETLNSLESELQAVRTMAAALEIRCPIAGSLHMNPSEGVLLSVSAVDSLVISIMLPQRNAHELVPGQAIQALIPGLGEELFRGQLLRVEREVLATARGPYIRAVGLLPNPEGKLETGMQGRARISVGRSTLLDRLHRGLRSILFQELGP
jgi:multidrug efflux pump subunit AcrA (membrane-fusion protein)